MLFKFNPYAMHKGLTTTYSNVTNKNEFNPYTKGSDND